MNGGRKTTYTVLLMIGGFTLVALAGCYRPAPPPPGNMTPVGPAGPTAPPPDAPYTTVLTDGSSQVAEITQVVAVGFQEWQPAYQVQVEIGVGGTSAGFERLCRGEIDLVNALRSIDAREAAVCAEGGVHWLEIVVAYDVLAVIANPADAFLSCVSLDELRAILGEGGAARWSEVRPGFPDLRLLPVATELNASQQSFLTDIVGGALRADAVPGGEDAALRVAQTPGAIGYLDYGRFASVGSDQGAASFVSIDSGAGCAAPTAEMVWRGLYSALARPLYLYVNKASLERLAAAQFVGYYLSADGQALIAEAGYLPSSPERYEAALRAMTGE